ncbi:ELL2 factor, partial [Galbula dea]|nr:ELL2 factor [Galbula dea]
VKRAPETILDFVPIRKKATPMNLERMTRKPKEQNTVYGRSYRDRVIHLLALRSYKKPELLARLYKDGIPEKDKNTLGTILQQVAKLNPKDNSYLLKDCLYKEIQKDWPGYSEVDKQSLELILSRKLESSQNATSSSNAQPPVTLNKGAPS